MDVNPSVLLLFALGVSNADVLFFGLAPAWQLTRRDWRGAAAR
jgi:hypothetical protein